MRWWFFFLKISFNSYRIQNLQKSKTEHYERELLNFQYKFNLHGALGIFLFFPIFIWFYLFYFLLEFSLANYNDQKNLRLSGYKNILKSLLQEKEYDACRKQSIERYQTRKVDINSCAPNIHHQLSKLAHGNVYGKLVVNERDYTITEVAAIQGIFCALKRLGYFHQELEIHMNK